MIDGEGNARITDFGLAGLAEEFATDELASGTPAYMAPEQLEGKSRLLRLTSIQILQAAVSH